MPPRRLRGVSQDLSLIARDRHAESQFDVGECFPRSGASSLIRKGPIGPGNCRWPDPFFRLRDTANPVRRSSVTIHDLEHSEMAVAGDLASERTLAVAQEKAAEPDPL